MVNLMCMIVLLNDLNKSVTSYLPVMELVLIFD